MSKKILSLMLVVCMVLSSITVTFAGGGEYNYTFTLAGGEYDATALNVGDTITLAVTIDTLKDRTAGVQYDIEYDTDVLEYVSKTNVIKNAYNGQMLLGPADWGTNTQTPGVLSVYFADGMSQAPNQGNMGLFAISHAETSTLFEITFRVLDDTANTTITPTRAIVSEYSTGSEVFSQLSDGNVAAPACTIKFVEDKPAVSVNWTIDTESVVGAMRFLFDAVATNGTITTSGIKYFATNDKDSTVKGEVAGTASTFYGDITEVPEDAIGTYYAAAYVVIGGQEYWSNVIPCVPTVGGAN